MSGREIQQLAPSVWDKGAHFFAFAVGATILTVALRLTTTWSWRKIFTVSVLALSLYGATDEYHQQFTPGRQGKNVDDWLADTIGALAGSALTLLIYARYARKSSPAPAGD